MVCPEDARQFLKPKPFGVLQPPLNYAQESPISDLYLVVGLRVSRGREVIFNYEFHTKFSISGVVKLLAIISDDDLGNPELTNDRPPGEVTEGSSSTHLVK